MSTDNLPPWMRERNERFAAERLALVQEILDQGLRSISCVSVSWPSRNIRQLTTSIGKTTRYAIVNPPEGFLRHGIFYVLLAKDSRLVELVEGEVFAEDWPVVSVLGRLP